MPPGLAGLGRFFVSLRQTMRRPLSLKEMKYHVTA